MNRISWDSTAPRRPTGARRSSASPRPEHDGVGEGLVEAEAELIHVAWDRTRRVGPF